MAESESILAALENCENEPIRTPDIIQPHGCVCVCDVQFEFVTHVSQNAELYFNRSPDAILGQPVNKVFERPFCHAIRNAASLRTVSTQREFLGEFDFGAGPVEVVCHQRGPHIIIEFGQKSGEHARHGLDINRLRWLMSKWEPHEHALDDALEILVHDLRMLTGFSRVMAYRFRPDGSGEVIAESLAPKADSFLGLRFPKWDIPDTARAIGLELPLRLISDVAAEDIPLLSWRDNGEPVDMTLTEFRGTSPVHKKYLLNMGVRASLVMPVVNKDVLWGMFSFQHKRPRNFSIRESLSIELVGQMLNAHLNNILEYNFDVGIERSKSIAQKFSELQSTVENSTFSKDEWESAAIEICSVMNLDGVALELDGEKFAYGAVADADMTQLMAHLQRTSAKGVYLSEELDEEPVAGALMIEIEGAQNKRLCLFRKEENQKVEWAGMPQKEPVTKDGQVRLLPRNSFASYTELSKGKCRAWEPDDLLMAAALQATMHEYGTQALGMGIEPDKKKEKSHDQLSYDMNCMAMITQSTIDAVPAEDASCVAYKTSIDKRLTALRSYINEELLVLSGHNIKEVIAKILKIPELSNTTVTGEDVKIHRDALFPSIIVINEVIKAHVYAQEVTKDDVVRLDVDCQISDQFFSIRFSGFNLELEEVDLFSKDDLERIKNIINQIEGNVNLTDQTNGYELTFNIPQKYVIERQRSSTKKNLSLNEATQSAVPSPRVLVLESNDAFEVELRIMLRRQGIEDVLFAKDHDLACEIIQNNSIDLALLNTRLLSQHPSTALDLLVEMKVPFAFMTSFRDEATWTEEYKQYPVLVKPIREGRLKNILGPAFWGNLESQMLTILLVEDNAPLQQQLKTELTRLGHQVECANNVHEAESILADVQIDLIVLDIFIDLGGNNVQEGTLRIVSRIRNEIKNNYKVERDVPIIAISGSVEIPGGFSPLKMASQIGVDECMQKPLNMKDFIGWISNVADQKSAKDIH